MQTLSFSGIDANNEISLFEYGLLVSNETHEDGSGTHFCIYRINEDLFGAGHFSENDINQLLLGNDWADEKTLNGFFSFVGSDKDEYLETSFVNKLFDLISYFGYENICGTDYSPLTREEVIERYL